MFGELLESRARRHRRTGGAALSIAAHVTIIGAAAVATVHATPSPPKAPEPVFVRFDAAPAPKPIEPGGAVAPTRTTASHVAAPPIPNLTITVPGVMPPTLPAIDASQSVTPDVFTVGPTASGARSGHPAGTLDLSDAPSSGDAWRGNELLMHILSSAKPRYPESLRQNGIDGRVVVQFRVDTTGRVDMNSVRIVTSTHDLFTQAVRASLGSFRFKPAEVGGKRTAALAEMPFEFEVKR